MQRDLDLVRRILLSLERADSTTGGHWSDLSGGDDAEMASLHYHVQLMNDAGLVLADELVPGQWFPERMTWEGHEFLDASRNDELWDQAKRRVERKLGTAPFEILRELLLGLAREQLEGSGPRGASGRKKK